MARRRLEQRAAGAGCPPAEGTEHQHLESPLPPALCCCSCAKEEGLQPGKCVEEHPWQRQMGRFRCEWVCRSTMGRRTALHSLDVSAKRGVVLGEGRWEESDSSGCDSGVQEWV